MLYNSFLYLWGFLTLILKFLSTLFKNIHPLFYDPHNFGFTTLIRYNPFKLRIWQFLSKQTPTPFGVDRTTTPSHSMRLWAPVRSFILWLFPVRFIFIRVPIDKGLVVSTNAPEADISLVWNSNTCFRSEVMGSILTGSVRENLWYFRCSSNYITSYDRCYCLNR